MHLLAAGLSFHTAPLQVRERAAIADARARTVLRFLVGHTGLREAAVLSTCNRTEFYLSATRAIDPVEVTERLARYLDPMGDAGLAAHLRTYSDAEAVQHMFRVASGLDSMVLGEAQILGQFKSAQRQAREAGTLGGVLDAVMTRAVRVGKRVRTETALGRGSGSVGDLGVAAAREALGDLGDREVLLIGAGSVARPVARQLARANARLQVISQGGASARALAEEVGGIAVDADRMDEAASSVDLIVACTNTHGMVLAAADVERLQDVRRNRPLLILDLGVPRDVDPDVARVTGVTVVDLDSLGERTATNLVSRRAEIPPAEAIVAAEVAPTLDLLRQRTTSAPTVAALVHRAEVMRRAEVERSAGRMGLDAEGEGRLEALTRALVAKLLHGPIAMLKDHGDDPAVALLIREAFALDGEAAPPDQRDAQ